MPKRERLTTKDGSGNSVFVDTSGWIALFSGRDQNHTDADRVFRSAIASNRQLLTTNLILAEVHRLLLYRAGIRAAAAALTRIESSHLVRIEFPGGDHHYAAKDFLEKLHEHPVSYTDAVSFAVMNAAGCDEVISYDHHFRLAGFASSL